MKEKMKIRRNGNQTSKILCEKKYHSVLLKAYEGEDTSDIIPIRVANLRLIDLPFFRNLIIFRAHQQLDRPNHEGEEYIHPPPPDL